MCRREYVFVRLALAQRANRRSSFNGMVTNEHTYMARRAFAGPGMVVWRWSIQDRAGQLLAHGTSITSEDAAKADAMAAMERLHGRSIV